MKTKFLVSAIGLSLAVLSSSPVLAAMKTVTLSVENMTCAVCPITVKKSLEKVPGVTQTKVSFETKEAIVTYDDSKTTLKTLEHATSEAGYPSSVKKGNAK